MVVVIRKARRGRTCRRSALSFALTVCLLASLSTAQNGAASAGGSALPSGSVVLSPQGQGAASSPASTGSNEVVYLKPARAAPGVSSAALTQQAWKALEKGNYQDVFMITDECEKRFGVRAQKQQAMLTAVPPPEKSFTYSALNDVATCMFIKGKALRQFKRNEEAKQVFRTIIRDYRFAQCWDPKGWFWKVAGAAQDEINCIDFNLDFGNYTSETLTAKAWKAYVAHRYEAMDFYIRKCVELYGDAAERMQSDLTDYPAKGQEADYWALNDVATCLYIRGKSLQRQGRNKEAAAVYQDILDRYSFGLCYDPNGWYWKVAEEAKRNLQFCG